MLEWKERPLRTTLGWLGVILVGVIAWKIPVETYLHLWHGFMVVFVTVLIAGVLAYVSKPPVDWLARQRLGRWTCPRFVAALLVVVVGVALLAFLVRLMIVPLVAEIGQFGQEWPRYQTALVKYFDYWLKRYGEIIPETLRESVESEITSQITRVTADLARLVTRGALTTVGWAAFVVELFLVPILTFYFITDAHSLKEEVLLLFPASRRENVVAALRKMDYALAHYVRGQLILCLLAAAVVTLGLVILQVDFAFTLGAVAGITRAVPIIGPVVGGIPIVLIAFLQQGSRIGLLVLIFFVLLHFVESKVILPRLIGYELHLHPAVVIIALLLGEALGGLLGLFLAAPVVAIVRVFLVEYRQRPAA